MLVCSNPSLIVSWTLSHSAIQLLCSRLSPTQSNYSRKSFRCAPFELENREMTLMVYSIPGFLAGLCLQVVSKVRVPTKNHFRISNISQTKQ